MDIDQIKDAYRNFHEEYLSGSPVLLKYMEHGVWAPSSIKDMWRLFRKHGGREKRFLDLGSGDGIAVATASLFFMEAHGIEIDESLYNSSNRLIELLGIKNAHLEKKDFMEADFSASDAIFIAPDKPFTLKLERKIRNELNGILIVYSSIFRPETLKPSEIIPTKHHETALYKNSAMNV